MSSESFEHCQTFIVAILKPNIRSNILSKTTICGKPKKQTLYTKFQLCLLHWAKLWANTVSKYLEAESWQLDFFLVRLKHFTTLSSSFFSLKNLVIRHKTEPSCLSGFSFTWKSIKKTILCQTLPNCLCWLACVHKDPWQYKQVQTVTAYSHIHK